MKTKSAILSLSAIMLLISSSSFVYGLVVGHYQIFPFDMLYKIKTSFNERVLSEFTLSNQLKKIAFTEEAPTSGLIYPAIKDIENLYHFNKRILYPRADFSKSYDEIIIGNPVEIDADGTPILKLPFELNGVYYNAFAYGKPFEKCNALADSAALIIPGGGNNQSLGIYQNDPNNYHKGILDGLNQVNKILVQIKPNRDARAWHNGFGKRVNGEFIYNWQLRMGGSYSVSYITEAIALMKYINKCSKETLVAGFSQGGAAALYVAFQASPSLAIISSGWSILFEKVPWASFGQIMGVPGSEIIATQKGLIDLLNQSSTQFLFTWGRSEKFFYHEEAHNFHTSLFLERAQNAFGVVHDGGHIFPVNEIRNFVTSNIPKTKKEFKMK